MVFSQKAPVPEIGEIINTSDGEPTWWSYVGPAQTRAKIRYVKVKCRCGFETEVRLTSIHSGRSGACRKCAKKYRKAQSQNLKELTGSEDHIYARIFTYRTNGVLSYDEWQSRRNDGIAKANRKRLGVKMGITGMVRHYAK